MIGVIWVTACTAVTAVTAVTAATAVPAVRRGDSLWRPARPGPTDDRDECSAVRAVSCDAVERWSKVGRQRCVGGLVSECGRVWSRPMAGHGCWWASGPPRNISGWAGGTKNSSESRALRPFRSVASSRRDFAALQYRFGPPSRLLRNWSFRFLALHVQRRGSSVPGRASESAASGLVHSYSGSSRCVPRLGLFSPGSGLRVGGFSFGPLARVRS